MVQFESHTVELPLIHKLEHDADVLEYYSQPSTLEIRYLSADGRLRRHRHTPDCFVIRHDGAGWIEGKCDDVLRKLSTNEPRRYQYTNDGILVLGEDPHQLFRPILELWTDADTLAPFSGQSTKCL